MFFIQTDFNTLSQERKLERLYVKYRRLMLKMAYGILHDYHLAEDAIHDVFIKLNENPDLIPDPDSGKAAPYLSVAAKNAARNYLEQINRSAETDDITEIQVEDKTLPDLADHLADKEATERIMSVIRGLDQIYREVLLLRLAYGYSAKQIATVTGRKEATVKKQLQRGKEILSEALGKEAAKYGRQ